MPLRVGYVREHFCSPLLQFDAVDQGKTFTLVECPSGTGQLISRLTKDEIDVAIALTDPLISGIAKGCKDYKLVGSYVSTPLNWAVITGKDSKYQTIADLKDTTIGISRIGSGSQTMAYVMGLQNGWPSENLKFQGKSSLIVPSSTHKNTPVNNDIHGLVDSVNDGTTSAFMWEWFTTKPWLDSGVVRFIGSVPTPWPSWLIAAQPKASTEDLTRFLASLTVHVREFDSAASRASKNVQFIKDKFGYPEEDIKAWMQTVAYPEDCSTISRKVIAETLSVLGKAGVVEGDFQVEDFIAPEVVKLV
ncbi:periplasmic binding protein-like II [Mycena floridula]|nr:periplasmic binding protein-like II [Mycena floridula]